MDNNIYSFHFTTMLYQILGVSFGKDGIARLKDIAENSEYYFTFAVVS